MVYYSFILFASCVWCVMSVKVEPITSPEFLSESPHWHEKQQALYYVTSGVSFNRINKYVPATGVHTKTTIDGRVGFILRVEGTCDQFLVGVERKFQVIRWDGREGSPICVVKELGEVDCDEPTNRINDGKADPRGRVFAGTAGAGEYPVYELKKASLFRLSGSSITKVANRITFSNGLAWDLSEKAMYYIDSWEKKIRRYDYDLETGEISNCSYIFDFEENEIKGFPDGATIDTDGNLWVAVFDGSSVIKIDPRTGELLRKVPMPVAQVTSVTFGGPDYDILYVTTANFNFTLSPNGATFMVTGLGVTGTANLGFKL